jgi:hypothetical protein
MKPSRLIVVALLGTLASVSAAQAKDARCFTTDDGNYPCHFQRLDEAGSFRISAAGKPTFELWIEAEGQGFASAIFEAGGRSVPLPGTYLRTKKDRACWKSDATETQICAW